MRFACCLLALALPLCAQPGSLTIHMILHAIGQETYQWTHDGDSLTLTTKFEYSDRGTLRTTTATLRMKPDYTPLSLEVRPRVSTVAIQGSAAAITEDTATRSAALPERYFTIFGSSPFAVQMAMLQYWKAHGSPAALTSLRVNPAAPPVRIDLAGHDSITGNGRTIPLDRYNIANLMYGTEILWMNPAGDLAAAMKMHSRMM